MDRDFSAKVKRRRIRRWAVLAVMAVACVAIAVPLALRKGGSGKADAEVTIAIRCDALMNDAAALQRAGLADVLPADGVILAETAVPVESGVTTVFDVTDDICRKRDIQIEYSYAPGYDSHYVEGIHYLYEFSAGRYSGWLFLVDGETPNYGADDVVLAGGEKIVWEYTTDYRDADKTQN